MHSSFDRTLEHSLSERELKSTLQSSCLDKEFIGERNIPATNNATVDIRPNFPDPFILFDRIVIDFIFSL